ASIRDRPDRFDSAEEAQIAATATTATATLARGVLGTIAVHLPNGVGRGSARASLRAGRVELGEDAVGPADERAVRLEPVLEHVPVVRVSADVRCDLLELGHLGRGGVAPSPDV